MGRMHNNGILAHWHTCLKQRRCNTIRFSNTFFWLVNHIFLSLTIFVLVSHEPNENQVNLSRKNYCNFSHEYTSYSKKLLHLQMNIQVTRNSIKVINIKMLSLLPFMLDNSTPHCQGLDPFHVWKDISIYLCIYWVMIPLPFSKEMKGSTWREVDT